ncbi:hypothetical protein GUITHDRAFT_111297 [Guillardia theta CCMP2712]|uniref:Uncharacterized protein n=1 Tax=Guillardia theta (strain CCMP2712) TaxID=905079 RepID=L1J258_GUITC|nr:hypothetical protein GUITHDRAFT_111297 [Guillardia theta CCMP2712]EKX42613.1 hypothetical protein GUITHDRAFT_111297 [Guillardia theta CCMP2712]|eukprot:XP_005829593.1 hypothetical protein GUITHDRAFT_111297 [Guillardia theta CCMP2712]
MLGRGRRAAFMASAAPSHPEASRQLARGGESERQAPMPTSANSRALVLGASLKYMDALRRFHEADRDAAVRDWVATRGRWLEHSKAKGGKDSLRSEQKQVLAGREAESRDTDAGQKDYMQALALFAEANGQQGLAERWNKAQAGWDYFYETNRLLDARQEKLDHQRAEILEKFLPRKSRKSAIKVDDYVPMWQPFSSCASSQDSALCTAASKLAPPPQVVGFVAVRSLEGQQLASQQMSQTGKEDSVQQELDKAFAGSNELQTRINRARFLLYLREFGPIPQLFGQAKTSSLYYPGDFEMPRVTDCDVPGSCHDWANGAYIDGFAAATTNWDMMGQPTPDDAWKGGYDTMPGGGAVTWRARTTSLAESSQVFDWKLFNQKEMHMEKQAKEAADMLMSTDLQDLPTKRLFATADPSLPQQLQDRKSAVGGAGTWAETHGEGGSSVPTSPSDFLQEWHPPAGLPFGGNIASKPVPARREEAKQQRLRKSLRHVEHLMDKQWEGRVDSLRAPMEKEEERKEANEAAREVEEEANSKFGLTPSGASDLERLRGSAKKTQLDKELHAAVASIDSALKPPSYSGPSSREGGRRDARGREANRGSSSSLFRREKVRLPGGGREERPKVESLVEQLRKEKVRNRLLQKKLRLAEREGFGASYEHKLKQSERGVADVVASKLAPEVVKEAAMLVAKKIEEGGKRRTRRERYAERAAESASARESARNAYEGVEGVYDDAPRYRRDMTGRHFPLAGGRRPRYPADRLEPGDEEKRRKAYPADEDYDEETRAIARRCHEHPEQCVGDDMEVAHRWERRRAGFARGIYNETEDEREQRRRMRRYSRGLNVTEYSDDDEPWDIRGGHSTVNRGQKEFAPHYFNHAFWSQLVHYFSRDKPTEFCNVCVGEFMTGLHDLNLHHVPASHVPLMCQGVCESNQALGFKFHRKVLSKGEEEATERRKELLRRIAKIVNKRSARNDKAALQAPPRSADYQPADILPTSSAAEAEAVRRELRNQKKMQRREERELRRQLKLHEKLERDNAIVGMADKGRTTELAEGKRGGGDKMKKMEAEANEVFNGGFQ